MANSRSSWACTARTAIKLPVVGACVLGAAATSGFGQLQLRARSYVFLLQDTSDAVYYLRAFDEGGTMYSEVALDVGRLHCKGIIYPRQ